MGHSTPMQMPWQRHPSFFGGNQFQQQQQQGPPGPFQYRPRGNGYGPCPWQTQQTANHNNTSSRPKKPRKEPTFIDYCDVCDRGFKNNAKKIEHYQQHRKCDEPGCSFEAHFKLVAMHKQNLHGPNALRIKVDTPADIKRWREERKRKYPSGSNIQKKAEKLSERVRQGNVLENKTFGKMRQNKQVKSVQETNSADVADISKQDQLANVNNVSSKSLLFSNSHDSSGEISSEDDTTVANSKNQSALGSLMQSYASSSGSELEEVEESTSVRKVQEPCSSASIKLTPAQPCPSPAEVCCDTSNLKIKSDSPASGYNKPNKRHGPNNNHVKGKKRQSLLEMLLANDIRKERNHILQCVRFVVNNNFFDPEVPIPN